MDDESTTADRILVDDERTPTLMNKKLLYSKACSGCERMISLDRKRFIEVTDNDLEIYCKYCRSLGLEHVKKLEELCDENAN